MNIEPGMMPPEPSYEEVRANEIIARINWLDGEIWDLTQERKELRDSLGEGYSI